MRIKLAAILLSLACVQAQAEVKDRYWQLGVGAYYGGLGTLTELDVARFDWIYLCYGNIAASRETTEQLNRLLQINPDLKIVIRVWPIMGLGDSPHNNNQATFLHYLYQPGVKQKLHRQIHDQIRVVLDHIDRPENVVGLTFLEELPGHFTGNPFKRGGKKLSWDLLQFRQQIEAERGMPLVWDEVTRRWWGTKWVQVINEIHAAMKTSSDDRLIFYYLQTNHDTLDMLPAGASIEQPRMVPHYWSDVIKPGLCDGFFAYPNNEKIWNTKYVALARRHNWLMFSQVSHPPFMRLSAWETNVQLARTRMPQNLGYFFFCDGNCAAKKVWNVDKGIPDGPEWNTLGHSRRLHVRRHLARHDVGMDIIRRQPALDLELDLPLDGARPGAFLRPRVVVANKRDPTFYLDPAEAIAADVTVTLKVPDGFSLPDDISPPATISLGHMKPGQRWEAEWWVKVPDDFSGRIDSPFVVTARADGSPPTTREAAVDTSMPLARPQRIGLSGTQWLEAAYRLGVPEVKPRIVIEALANGVRNPSVGEKDSAVTWRGQLDLGQKLVLDPDNTARLIHGPLLLDDGSSRRDQRDPNGFEPFDEGYLVARANTHALVDPDVPLRVTISGKAAGGAQSLVVLRYEKDGGHIDQSILTNRFSSEWRTVTEEVKPPAEARGLAHLFLYRFKQKGTIWYGPLKVERADATEEGVDVAAQLEGTFPSLTQGVFHVYEYRDEGPLSYAPRVRVQLVVP